MAPPRSSGPSARGVVLATLALLAALALALSLPRVAALDEPEKARERAPTEAREPAATPTTTPPAVVSFTANKPAQSRFAYVTVHYEGTSRDPEYVLGVQVLMQSIKLTGTPHDLVVLASDSVSEASKRLFAEIGCRVIDVTNIDNPFLGGTLSNKNFIYTLNKLHVWNLLEYDRVVYLDADNVLIRNSDELFLCGNFCAVFMNPCHFHTGLLVVSPNANEYQRLLQGLNSHESFDGADQGFLSSMYSQALRKAPLFVPDKAKQLTQLPKGMRLSVGYNINHKYFYEQYHWKLFYLRHFASMTSPISPVRVVVESARAIPALTVGFPMAPVLKPWYWWASFFMDLHAVWHDISCYIAGETGVVRYGGGVQDYGVIRYMDGASYCSSLRNEDMAPHASYPEAMPRATLEEQCLGLARFLVVARGTRSYRGAILPRRCTSAGAGTLRVHAHGAQERAAPHLCCVCDLQLLVATPDHFDAPCPVRVSILGLRRVHVGTRVFHRMVQHVASLPERTLASDHDCGLADWLRCVASLLLQALP